MSALIVLAGQSNALGFRVQASDMPAAITAPNPHALIWNPAAQAFEVMLPGVNTGTPNNPTAVGPEAEFAARWTAEHPGETLYIVKAVKGSTGLAADPDQLDWSPHSKGELFDTTTAQVEAAKAASGVSKVSAILWVQGEQDAVSAAKASGYAFNLIDAFAEMRAKWGDASTPIVLGRLSDTPRLEHADGVQLGQDIAASFLPGVAEVQTDGLGMQADQLHFDAAGQVGLGDELYDALLALGRTLTGGGGFAPLHPFGEWFL